MAEALYSIADEPHPGGLARYAVGPIWPFVAVMFGGALLSWAWFLFNGYAVGSPTRRRETTWVIVGIAGNVVITLAILWLIGADLVTGKAGVAYVMLALVVWKLGVTYALYVLQSHTLALYEYYGGHLRNGLPVLIVGVLVIGPALARVDNPLVSLVLR